MKDERLIRTMSTSEKRFGDIAVDGLLAGVAAGLVMALVLAIGGLLREETVAELFRRFAPGEEASALSGFLAHVAVSAIYGLLFALLRQAVPHSRRGWTSVLAGMVYGLLLLALAQSVLLRNSASSLLMLPPAVLAAGHVVYGLALGWLLARVEV